MNNSNEIYPYRFGTLDLTVLRDESSVIEPESFFTGIPESELRECFNSGDSSQKTNFDISCMLIKTENEKILLDTGVGVSANGKLLKNLKATGTDPQDINIVIISHAHLDHTGGNCTIEGNLTFPNAQYIIGEKELSFWTSEPDLSRYRREIQEELLTTFDTNINAIRDQLTTVSGDHEIRPGIHVSEAPGHTPGLMLVTITSGDQSLFYISDIIQHEMEIIHPNWCTAFDLDPEQTVKTRKQVISKATESSALVFASHLPFPGLGRFTRKESSWRWKPI